MGIQVEFPVLNAPKPQFFPESMNTIPANVDFLLGEFLLNPRGPIGTSPFFMGFQNHRLQYSVALGSQRQRAASLGVEATPGHTERSAKNLDGVLESQHVHDRILGNDSLAKYAVAFFKISSFIFASASSLRSFEFSASNSLTDGAPGIVASSSPSNFASQFPTVPLGIPSFFPTSDWVSPSRVIILTASAFNSSL